MTITTTNYLKEGDIIKIGMPDPIYFSETSKCLGVSSNIRKDQVFEIAVNLDVMTISLQLPLAFNALGRRLGSTAIVPAG